jgi:23S rRNA pseudouridine1911/1915/1917 synthase
LEHSQTIISTDVFPTAGAEPDEDLADDSGDLHPGAVEVRHFSVPTQLHGMRLDRVMAELVPEFSRSYLRQLLGIGAVLHKGQAARKPAVAVKAGDSVQVHMRATPQSQAFKPEPIPLVTVFEDAFLRVVHKPAGLVVHPAPGNWSGTLLNGLLSLDPCAADLPRAGIVHRLDKDTSGLMVVARQRQTMDALVKLIAAREVSRQYLALGHRAWSGPSMREVDMPLGRDPRNRLRMAVVDLQRHPGKLAQTQVELLASGEGHCLVRCTLRTGRTHQIRVHMASLGHPLVADALYGGAPDAGLLRQALHAYRLAFVHPATGAALEFNAPVPPDFAAAIGQLGLGYNLQRDAGPDEDPSGLRLGR